MAYCVDGEGPVASEEILKRDPIGAGDGVGVEGVGGVEIGDLVWYVRTPGWG